jgi:phospholipase C
MRRGSRTEPDGPSGTSYETQASCVSGVGRDSDKEEAMAEETRGGAADYLICRSSEGPDYSVWRVDIDGDQLLSRVQIGKFDQSHQLIPIGNYILEWGPLMLQDYSPCFPYRLFRFDPNIDDPLSISAMTLDSESHKPISTLVATGTWPKKKFWGTRPDFGNPDGPAKEFDKGEKLMLVPLGTFVLNVIPTPGRGTFKLFYFDPGSSDPLYVFPTWISGAFETINYPHELIPLGNYVLNRHPNAKEYRLWSFDPMGETPLARPAIQEGRWDDIDENHQLIPIGEYVLDWDMVGRSYRLWRFDPKSRNPKSNNPLAGPVKQGPMPKELAGQMTPGGIKGNVLTGIQRMRPIDEARKDVPGTIDFMRTRIKHVVFYMIENRSFDHICGWLYEKDEGPITFIGHDRPFEGASLDMFNVDPDAPPPNERHLRKHAPGETIVQADPYHDMTDTMRQFFFDGRDYDRDGYERGATPHMGGFVWNQGNSDVMVTFTPDQLTVLNGLAKAFAVSDEWFCSMPGATDSQRAFALTGSALGQLNNFMNGPQYTSWPDLPRRASIWKVLWANGFTDWKIYNSVAWFQFVLTYHLFLQGQIPSVDANPANWVITGLGGTSGLDRFLKDARAGNLPAFSFLEPVWIASDRPATSYHPYGGGGTHPGEQALNDIYEALKASPKWNETLLVITFDEHGGFFDHMPPPYAANPWPNDENDGFRYDLMGVRVPTILVSPWIKQRTVFRSPTPVAYDSTSVIATLLNWYGIPKGRWGLGERTHHAPTFEGVFQCQSPRTDKPVFEPSDKAFAVAEPSRQTLGDLHELMAWRAAIAIVGNKVDAQQAINIANGIVERASSVETLNELLDALAKRMG